MTKQRADAAHDADLDILLTRAAAVATKDLGDSAQYLALESRVLGQALPPQPLAPIDTLIQWLTPQNRFSWQAPCAASFALLLGIAVANVYDFGLGSEHAFESELISWEDELSLLSFTELSPGVTPADDANGDQTND